MRGNVALCAADNSDRYWRFGSGGAKLCTEADEGGFNAAAVRDMHALLATVQASSPDDLLLAISYTGVRRELNTAADEMLRVGGKVLAITGFTPNALQQRASHCLYTIAEEQATNSASISACHAQGMLTDLLFIALIQQDLELAPERIRHSEALVKKLV